MNDLNKYKKIIPIGEQKYAYQCESMNHIFKLEAYTHGGKGNGPYPNQEAKEVWKYELELQRHTGNAMTVTLTKFLPMGKKAIFTTSMSFSRFVNQLFSEVEVNEFIESK